VTVGFYAMRGSPEATQCEYDDFFYCPGRVNDDVNEEQGSKPIQRASAICVDGEKAWGQGNFKRCDPCPKGHYCKAGLAIL